MRKIIELGTCMALFLLPWQTRRIIELGIINGNVSEYLSLSLYIVDILLIVLLLVALFYYQKRVLSLLWLNAWRMKLLIFFLFLNLISISWAINRTLAFEHFVWMMLATGLGLLICRHRNKSKLIFWFLVSLLFSAWLGIFQFFAQKAFANKWLGLAFHDPSAAGTSIVEFYVNGEAIRWLRSYGSFDNPNIFGVLMGIGIILIFWKILENKKAKHENIFIYFSLISFSIGLFCSLSRDAWVGTVLAIAVILAKLFWQKSFDDLRKFKNPSLVIAAIFIIAIFLYPAQFAMRSGGDGRLEKRSISDRVFFLQQGEKVISQNWLLGVGTGNFIEALKMNNSVNQDWTYQPVHNVPLLIWSEVGIFGFIIATILLVILFIAAWQQGVIELGLIMVFVPSLMLDHWLWSLHFGLLMTGFIVGFLLNKSK